MEEEGFKNPVKITNAFAYITAKLLDHHKDKSLSDMLNIIEGGEEKELKYSGKKFKPRSKEFMKK